MTVKIKGGFFMKLKKICAVTLSVVMVFTSLAACGSSNTPNNSNIGSQSSGQQATPVSTEDLEHPETWKNFTDPIEFTWYIHASWFTRRWGTSLTSQYITDKTGVSIDFIAPAGNEAERLNTMIIGNTFPDIISLGWYEPQVPQIYEAELVYALEELAEQYDPYFFQVASPEKLGWYRQADGNVYGYPNASYTLSDFEKYADTMSSNQTFLVKKDIYEAIGSPDMSTPEGFLGALEKAKEQFPTVNGQPLIPLGLQNFHDTGNDSIDVLLMNYLAIPQEDENGNLHDRFMDSEFRDWVKVLRQANEDGLIARDVFIDGRPQIEEKVAQGRYFAMMYQAQDMIAQNTSLYANDPDSVYIAVRGPGHSNGADPELSGGGISGWMLTMISKNCKDPARAIQFLSYLISEEGQHDVKLGAPSMWHTVDGKDQLTPEMEALNNSDKDKFEVEYGADSTYWMLMDNAMQEQWASEVAQPLRQTREWTQPYVVYNATYDGVDALEPGSPEEINNSRVSLEWGRLLPQMLMADSEAEVDELFEKLVEAREKNNWDRIWELRNEKLKENKAKLGL